MKKHSDSFIKEVRELMYSSRHAVFFGGAGVSTDSGIPDFRSSKGIYSDTSNEYYLSRSCLYNEPEKFFDFYRKNMIFPNAKPNKTHIVLAELEKRGIIKAVVTQNIDGLHQAAGSKNVIELHGTVKRCYCMNCKREYDGSIINNGNHIPVCPVCGGMIRPDVTLYEENLDTLSLYGAKNHIEKTDLLIVGGTSLNVYPAAGFVADYLGAHLVIINLSPTPYDDKAEYVIREPLSQVFEKFL
ncbi:MAG: NAD-dependent protein deacylase [Ruminococcaceae bacterium]|nr:NAD-dependent protein deacylase [Oscillospiraceae bacterium]